jgi:dephospho-CoA kinase
MSLAENAHPSEDAPVSAPSGGLEPPPPLVIGVIGGIASGKSAVAGLFEAAGLVRLDADAAARQATDRPEVRAGLRQRFGRIVPALPEPLDRTALAAVVFRDPEARADLDALTHPAIRARLLSGLAEAREAGRDVALDVPLLLEGGLVSRCDEVVFVDTPDDIRHARAAGRGWAPDELARREAAQLPLPVKRARATATIDNSSTLEHAAQQVERLMQAFRAARQNSPQRPDPAEPPPQAAPLPPP